MDKTYTARAAEVQNSEIPKYFTYIFIFLEFDIFQSSSAAMYEFRFVRSVPNTLDAV